MSSPSNVFAGVGVALGLLVGSSQTQVPAGVADAAAARVRAHLAGVWEYNADESVNAYSGRPETTPANARTSGRPTSASGSTSGGGRRPPGSSGPPPGAMGSGTGGSGGMGGSASGTAPGGGWGGSDDWNAGYRGWAAAWARTAQRDLLEVPWQYTITVSDDAVTFVDDLERSRSYETDGKRRKYQLAAAVFHAKTVWDGDRLKKTVDAVGQFKMTETYFLSEDYRRLFVIIRLGDPEKATKERPLAGVNRVYDRVQ
jgi:hypothetical protein